jgi:hypothetical protein
MEFTEEHIDPDYYKLKDWSWQDLLKIRDACNVLERYGYHDAELVYAVEQEIKKRAGNAKNGVVRGGEPT